MERKRFGVTYFLRKARTNKAGLTPILARITTNGVSKEIYIQCSVPVDKWSQSKERATGKDKLCQQVNSYLDDYRARILAVRQELISKGYEGNCIQIKERLQNPATLSIMFLAELAKYCEKRQTEVGVRITQLTANKYHRVLRYLREYVASAYRKEDLLLSAVGYEFLDGFNTFLQTAHKCKHNGAVNLLDCVKNFTRYCLRNEWIEKDPFRNYKLKEEHNKEKDHLTREELETLVRKRLPNDRLDRIRDVFCFCCLTGMAHADVKGLTQEMIQRSFDGDLWIVKRRQKTDTPFKIKLCGITKRIIARYKREVADTNLVLPVPDIAYCNRVLKKIAAEVGIDKTITYHMARHTFATTNALAQGIRIEVVSRMLGHTNIKTTQIYAKVTDDMLAKGFDEMADIYSTKYSLAR